MTALRADPAAAIVPVAIAPDATTAERWAATLARAGIDAHIRIDDGLPFQRLGSIYAGPAYGSQFVYPVLVSRVQRRRARRVLDEAEASSSRRRVTSAASLAAAFGVIALTAVAVFALAWVRGDL